MVCRALANGFAIPIVLGITRDYCIVSQGISPLKIEKTADWVKLRISNHSTRLASVFSRLNKAENPEGQKETHFTTEFTSTYNLSDRMTLFGMVLLTCRSISLDSNGGHD